MDVQTINDKLMKCKATMLLSNPCFEIWLLLHVKNQKAAISSDAIIKELKISKPIWKNYAKSVITDTQKDFLYKNTSAAVVRAMELHEFENPSTGIYKLIKILKGDTRLSPEGRE